jgi:glutathione synthase/RimK-type ligase-like ATP-grasp enzyme
VRTLFIVDGEHDWPAGVRGATVATAKDYLTGAAGENGDDARVLNLCGCDRLQGAGYYVSLLAEARGHDPFPAAKTLNDLSVAPVAPELRALEALAAFRQPAQGEARVHAYFGCDPDGGNAPLAHQLFSVLKLPLARATFRGEAGQWRVARVEALGLAEVPPAHREALGRALQQFLGAEQARAPASGRPAIAILHTPGEPLPPSNPAALQKFVAAARKLGMRAELIDRHALDRLEKFDALFIRDTTYLDHYTYEFSRRAAALGLVVIDDADSILQCNNKVYLNELLTRNGIPVPKTVMVHRDNVGEIVPALGLPCILKQPDGGFSLGVRKAASEEDARREAAELLAKSELIVAQEYLPTEFDWRVTVLDRRVMFVCKYFMAPGHWQVHKYGREGHLEGATAALSVGEAPSEVVATALRAANLIGDGLYGVDLKQAGGRCCVVEINDNPNVDAGNEDGVLKDALYREMMGVFLRRIAEREPATAK